MKKVFTFMLSTIFITLIAFGAGMVGSFVGLELFEADDVTTQTVTQQDVEIVNEDSAIIDVAEESSDSVVSIIITQDVPLFENYYYNPFEGNPFFDGFEVPGQRQNGTEERQVGSGSGFVVSEDGLIITNRHVVDIEDASYTVIFGDGTQIEAEVLARDTLLDIAFLQVEADNLTPLPLGSSENLQVGQRVIAVGNALGEFSNTVSTGIISGLSRDIVASDSSGRNPEQLSDVIQTDASINPGNSGGPLMDINGNVIGVNVAVAQSAENIGFAIPIDIVKDLIDRLNEDGSIDRPVLGVRYRLITDDFAERNELPIDYGAILLPGVNSEQLAVIPGSPADKAGLEAYDIILEIDGERIDLDNPLQDIIQNNRFGNTIELLYLSDGERETVEVLLEEF